MSAPTERVVGPTVPSTTPALECEACGRTTDVQSFVEDGVIIDLCGGCLNPDLELPGLAEELLAHIPKRKELG